MGILSDEWDYLTSLVDSGTTVKDVLLMPTVATGIVISDVVGGDSPTTQGISQSQDDRDTFTLDGVLYYTDNGQPVPPPQPATKSPTLTDRALSALGLGGMGAPGQTSNDPFGLGQLKDVLFYAAILSGLVLALYIAVQIKLALR